MTLRAWDLLLGSPRPWDFGSPQLVLHLSRHRAQAPPRIRPGCLSGAVLVAAANLRPRHPSGEGHRPRASAHHDAPGAPGGRRQPHRFRRSAADFPVCPFMISWMMGDDLMFERMMPLWEKLRLIPVDRSGQSSIAFKSAIRKLETTVSSASSPRAASVFPEEIRPFFDGVGASSPAGRPTPFWSGSMEPRKPRPSSPRSSAEAMPPSISSNTSPTTGSETPASSLNVFDRNCSQPADGRPMRNRCRCSFRAPGRSEPASSGRLAA